MMLTNSDTIRDVILFPTMKPPTSPVERIYTRVRDRMMDDLRAL